MVSRDNLVIAPGRNEFEALNHVGAVEAALVVRGVFRNRWILERLADADVPIRVGAGISGGRAPMSRRTPMTMRRSRCCGTPRSAMSTT